jgi:hypothetical protein
LFFVNLATAAVEIGGVTKHRDDPGMMQIARNLTDSEGTFLLSRRCWASILRTTTVSAITTDLATRCAQLHWVGPPLRAREASGAIRMLSFYHREAA